VGNQVIGGKDDYWAIWDVLKDVEELTSVEFFVKSELLRDLSEPERVREKAYANKFEKRIFNVMPMVSTPGPRVGGMFGVNGAQMDYYEDLGHTLLYHSGVMTNGLSAGLLLGTGRVSAALMFMKYDPGSVEKKNDGFRLMTPMNLITAGIGVRF